MLVILILAFHALDFAATVAEVSNDDIFEDNDDGLILNSLLFAPFPKLF